MTCDRATQKGSVADDIPSHACRPRVHNAKVIVIPFSLSTNCMNCPPSCSDQKISEACAGTSSFPYDIHHRVAAH